MKNQSRCLTQQYLELSRKIMWSRFGQWRRGNPRQLEGRIMAVLRMQKEISRQELAYLLGVPDSPLENVLFKLEQKGVVCPVQEKDGYIRLMEPGVPGSAETDQTADSRVFSCLSKEEQDVLRSLLERLEENLCSEGEAGNMGFGRRQDRRENFWGQHGFPFWANRGCEGFGEQWIDYSN